MFRHLPERASSKAFSRAVLLDTMINKRREETFCSSDLSKGEGNRLPFERQAPGPASWDGVVTIIDSQY
jgi:hypothetical protein